jgi:hypothetical protein
MRHKGPGPEWRNMLHSYDVMKINASKKGKWKVVTKFREEFHIWKASKRRKALGHAIDWSNDWESKQTGLTIDSGILFFATLTIGWKINAGRKERRKGRFETARPPCGKQRKSNLFGREEMNDNFRACSKEGVEAENLEITQTFAGKDWEGSVPVNTEADSWLTEKPLWIHDENIVLYRELLGGESGPTRAWKNGKSSGEHNRLCLIQRFSAANGPKWLDQKCLWELIHSPSCAWHDFPFPLNMREIVEFGAEPLRSVNRKSRVSCYLRNYPHLRAWFFVE